MISRHTILATVFLLLLLTVGSFKFNRVLYTSINKYRQRSSTHRRATHIYS